MAKETKIDRRRPLEKRVISLRVGELADDIDSRCGEADGESAAGVIKRDLARYYRVLQEELASLDFTEGEASLVCDACNGLFFDDATSTHRFIWAEVADAIQLQHLDKKWTVAGDRLVKKLRDMTSGQAMAVADAIQRFWAEPQRDTRELLLEVGLLKRPRTGLEPS